VLKWHDSCKRGPLALLSFLVSFSQHRTRIVLIFTPFPSFDSWAMVFIYTRGSLKHAWKMFIIIGAILFFVYWSWLLPFFRTKNPLLWNMDWHWPAIGSVELGCKKNKNEEEYMCFYVLKAILERINFFYFKLIFFWCF
jgi:hypothetical protein